MENILKSSLIEFRKNCSGNKCDSCKLGNMKVDTGESEWDLCLMIAIIENKLDEK